MAKKYHPDKIQSNDEALKKGAKKNFKEYKMHMKKFKKRGSNDSFYFNLLLGFQHVLDLDGLDHLFFIVVLVINIHLKCGRKLLYGLLFLHLDTQFHSFSGIIIK